MWVWRRLFCIKTKVSSCACVWKNRLVVYAPSATSEMITQRETEREKETCRSVTSWTLFLVQHEHTQRRKKEEDEKQRKRRNVNKRWRTKDKRSQLTNWELATTTTKRRKQQHNTTTKKKRTTVKSRTRLRTTTKTYLEIWWNTKHSGFPCAALETSPALIWLTMTKSRFFFFLLLLKLLNKSSTDLIDNDQVPFFLLSSAVKTPEQVQHWSDWQWPSPVFSSFFCC